MLGNSVTPQGVGRAASCSDGHSPRPFSSTAVEQNSVAPCGVRASSALPRGGLTSVGEQGTCASSMCAQPASHALSSACAAEPRECPGEALSGAFSGLSGSKDVRVSSFRGQKHSSVITGRVGPSSAPRISQTVLTSAPSACAAAPVAILSEVTVRSDDQVQPACQRDPAELNYLRQEGASSLRECDRMDQQLREALVHAASMSLTWTGRGAGRRPVYLAACVGQGYARPLSGEAPACLPCAEAGTLPPVGRIVHARAFGHWRPAMVVLCGPEPRTVLVRWWHDSRLCVLTVADLVVTPDGLQYEQEVGPDPAMEGPPLTLGQAAYARFDGKWYPGIIRRLLPDARGVQIMWTADFSKSNVPLLDVRTVPAWMLDPATLDRPELREWLAEITGRWPPWEQVASVGEPSPTIPEEDGSATTKTT